MWCAHTKREGKKKTKSFLQLKLHKAKNASNHGQHRNIRWQLLELMSDIYPPVYVGASNHGQQKNIRCIKSSPTHLVINYSSPVWVGEEKTFLVITSFFFFFLATQFNNLWSKNLVVQVQTVQWIEWKTNPSNTKNDSPTPKVSAECNSILESNS